MITPNPEKVHIDFNQRVPMRDGVMLSADIYRPADSAGAEQSCPVVLMRTPYMKANERALEYGVYLAEHGHVFVAMDVRGRGDSDGVFVPYFNEGRDGYDSIARAHGNHKPELINISMRDATATTP